MAQQIHELVEQAAQRTPSATALRQGAARVSYSGLAAAGAAVGGALTQGGAEPNERVAACRPARRRWRPCSAPPAPAAPSSG